MRKLLFLLLTLLISVVALAEGEVSWKLKAIEGKGPVYQAVVEATMKDGWHLYPVREQEGGPSPTYFTVDGVDVPKINGEGPLHTEFDKGFQKDIDSFIGTGTFLVPVTLKSPGKPPTISVNFQVCKDGVCIPPQDVTIDSTGVEFKETLTTLEATKAPPVAPSAGPTVPASTEAQQIEDAQKKGLLPFLALAFVAGLTALLTPCVFPMIPITVSFFSKKKEGESALTGAMLYCGGIIGTFTLLGILMSVLVGATGLTNLANDPILNLVLAVIFIVLALSLFGVFEIGLPSKFVNSFDSSKVSKVFAPVLMGLTFSLTSFTCTLPFVGAVLVGASKGNYLYPTLGMLAFSGAFSIPFFLLALFPAMASKLPKSGGWMSTVKAYLGFIELIAAVKFLSTFDLGYSLGFITREINIAIWFSLLAMAAAYMFGWIRLPKVHDGKAGPLRLGFGVLTLALGFWILSSLSGTKLGNLEGFLPPSPYPGKA
ncbi:MAG TPA: cytochrome c biogenesis protein CcdA, partial [Fimbriimonas sp.]|nr:cytochrome c biogenesis protein CcdA [Fimbriimonas sp.]